MSVLSVSVTLVRAAACPSIMCLVFALGCGEPRSTKVAPRRHVAAGWRKHTIWQRPKSLSAEFTFSLRDGIAIAKHFRSPADGQVLSGGFYVTGIDRTAKRMPVRHIIVSVCTSENGHLGDIADTRLSAALVTATLVGSLEVAQRMPFSIDCDLTKGHDYWLILEAAWRESPPVYAYHKYVALLADKHPSQPSVIRTSWTPQFDGPKLGDEYGIGFVADLQLSEKTSGMAVRPKNSIRD